MLLPTSCQAIGRHVGHRLPRQAPPLRPVAASPDSSRGLTGSRHVAFPAVAPASITQTLSGSGLWKTSLPDRDARSKNPTEFTRSETRIAPTGFCLPSAASSRQWGPSDSREAFKPYAVSRLASPKRILFAEEKTSLTYKSYSLTLKVAACCCSATRCRATAYKSYSLTLKVAAAKGGNRTGPWASRRIRAT